ncbi:MAG: hypothetical protein LBL46_00925 [Rickettsiales bacterium]|nr:hypothetical protein [Rickettsiales bacterium]
MKNKISNEQRAMSNRNARQRNSKLLLFIACCSLLITGGGEAGAAKLCWYNNTSGNSYAINEDNTLWAVGTGCGDRTGWGWDKANIKTGAATGFCTTTAYAGECVVVKSAFEPGTQDMCRCRLTSPGTSGWVVYQSIHPDVVGQCARYVALGFGGNVEARKQYFGIAGL